MVPAFRIRRRPGSTKFPDSVSRFQAFPGTFGAKVPWPWQETPGDGYRQPDAFLMRDGAALRDYSKATCALWRNDDDGQSLRINVSTGIAQQRLWHDYFRFRRVADGRNHRMKGCRHDMTGQARRGDISLSQPRGLRLWLKPHYIPHISFISPSAIFFCSSPRMA